MSRAEGGGVPTPPPENLPFTPPILNPCLDSDVLDACLQESLDERTVRERLPRFGRDSPQAISQPHLIRLPAFATYPLVSR